VSGETESNVSGWTTDTLHSHMAQRLNDVDRMLSRRMDDADKAIQAALAAAEKATDKANDANEKRFEGVNEFRRALADQTGTFIPRTEYDAAHSALTDRVDANAERMAALELRLTSRLDRGEGSDAGAAGQRGEARLNMSQVIAAIATLAAVISFIYAVVKK
jgi:ElaB/YqjD/DUF883 family membrane-anchored ribosome-binding protein